MKNLTPSPNYMTLEMSERGRVGEKPSPIAMLTQVWEVSSGCRTLLWHHGGGGGGLEAIGPSPILERAKWHPGMPKEAGLASEGTPPPLC